MMGPLALLPDDAVVALVFHGRTAEAAANALRVCEQLAANGLQFAVGYRRYAEAYAELDRRVGDLDPGLIGWLREAREGADRELAAAAVVKVLRG